MEPRAPTIAAHEFGHSTFSLGDEYSWGSATASNSPNCETAGCSTWADIVAESLGENGSSCTASKCKGNAYFSPGTSLMEYLSYPFGVVNERFTCCAYLALPGATLGGIPPYCRRFMASGTSFGSFPVVPAPGGVGIDLQSFCDDESRWSNPFDFGSSAAHHDHGIIHDAATQLVHIGPGDHGPAIAVELPRR